MFDFESCTYEELFNVLSKSSRQLVNSLLNKRYKNNYEMSEKIKAAYEHVKRLRKLKQSYVPSPEDKIPPSVEVVVWRKGVRTSIKAPSPELRKKIYDARRLWGRLLFRCDKSKPDYHKNRFYAHCEVSDNFRDREFFVKWCLQQVGFSEKDEQGKKWELDKDILSTKQKIYSEDTCVFVPREINVFAVEQRASGGLPLGVSRESKGRGYIATYRGHYLGLFTTPEEASTSYCEARAERAKFLARKWEGKVDQRVHNFLNTYGT